jgi:hypothetical protein
METSVRPSGDGNEPLDAVTGMPYRKPLRTWAGHGTGATCHGCGGAIEPHEIEYEIELADDSVGRAQPFQAGSDGKSLRFHFGCYRNWTGR